jgi:tRNA (guanine-N7-)-methyltransferase
MAGRPHPEQSTCDVTLADFSAGQGLRHLFGRQAPRELEIGCGKGRFIVRSAQSMPERDFLGVELAVRYYRIGRDRGDRRGLTNLKMLCGDALFLMRHVLEDASLSAIHILFPDPWPKKRHNKRRMFRPEFLNAVLRVLEDGGELNAASDHADYWQAILPEVAAFKQLEKQSGFALDARLPPGEVGHTNYEVKYRHSGRPIYQSTWLRRPR